MFSLSVRFDMPDFNAQDRHQMVHLISESMEARMQTREALLRLQSTVNAMQPLLADNWSTRDADQVPTSKGLELLISAPSIHVAVNNLVGGAASTQLLRVA